MTTLLIRGRRGDTDRGEGHVTTKIGVRQLQAMEHMEPPEAEEAK